MLIDITTNASRRIHPRSKTFLFLVCVGPPCPNGLHSSPLLREESRLLQTFSGMQEFNYTSQIAKFFFIIHWQTCGQQIATTVFSILKFWARVQAGIYFVTERRPKFGTQKWDMQIPASFSILKIQNSSNFFQCCPLLQKGNIQKAKIRKSCGKNAIESLLNSEF